MSESFVLPIEKRARRVELRATEEGLTVWPHCQLSIGCLAPAVEHTALCFMDGIESENLVRIFRISVQREDFMILLRLYK